MKALIRQRWRVIARLTRDFGNLTYDNLKIAKEGIILSGPATAQRDRDFLKTGKPMLHLLILKSATIEEMAAQIAWLVI